jgi:hypothetical protein
MTSARLRSRQPHLTATRSHFFSIMHIFESGDAADNETYEGRG